MPGTIYLQRPTPTWQAVGPTMATDLFRTLLARNMRSQLMQEEDAMSRARQPAYGDFFTLGDTRYGVSPSGKAVPIVSKPKEPEKPTSPYVSEFTLGDTRYGMDAEGKTTKIVSAPPKPVDPKSPYVSQFTLDNIRYGLKADGTTEVIRRGREQKPTNVMDLTRLALQGDKEAAAVLEADQKRKIEQAEAQGAAIVRARLESFDVDSVAQAVIDGQMTIEQVKNTFGVPVQPVVMSKILDKDPNFNFVKPGVLAASLKSSLTFQQKQRGAMGSFVKNINKQLDRIDYLTKEKEIVKRFGLRALDMPRRELIKRAVGSGNEVVLELYLAEISREIGKLASGSQASIRELSTEAQKKWDKIHDPNLSINELRKVLEETRHVGGMRMESVDEEIQFTLDTLGRITPKGGLKKKEKSKYNIIEVVE